MYLIQGNNFVKVRDIGKPVDFFVDYDGAANSIYLAPNAPYKKEGNLPEPSQSGPMRTSPLPSRVRTASSFSCAGSGSFPSAAVA